MRVICDAPGQTCNRLWTYVTSVAQCIAENKKMVIIFYDWTIEDFPNLLHCPFIYFPLWHPWYLKRGNGWNNYKGLTWKVTHNKTWDKIFKFFGFSSYSRWASFIGEVPLCFLESKKQQFTEESFSIIVDFFHFENGKELFDW
jgi:hypothetical protein